MVSKVSSRTTTFLFTDIEGSTRLWETQPASMKPALALHDAVLRTAIESNNGQLIKTTGDGVHAGFSNALDAVNAALSAQRQFQAPLGDLQLKIRMGVYTGEAEMRAGDYYGTALNRATRLMSAAHSGQILVSNATAELLRDQLPPGAALRDLGEHRLKDLARPEHIFQLTHPDLPAEFPPVKSIDSFPNNLPVQLTSFVGREKEITEIKSLLDGARLVTLTGSGGTGKTRLSLEVGAQELGNYPHGVWLIELAPLVDPAQIIPAVAQTFGLQEMPYTSLAAMVADYLRDKQLLILLDNCEHLIESCARLADDWLHQCKRLKILASSREGLGIAGEVSYRIPSLESRDSIHLYVERARAANPKFTQTEANAPAIAKICARLDGIPLAIELAAARCKLLSPEQIAARLNDRFRLLVGGSRTALPRQQTLRAMIDWSYDLLAVEEKRLMQFAAVFVGGWTLEALEAVADDPHAIEHLEQLVNKSMVVAVEHESEMRYTMLETIRQYAREKLFDSQEATAARDRHFVYFDQLSEEIWDAFRFLRGFTLLRDRADDEFENMRAALEWGVDNHPDSAIHLAANFTIISSWTGSQIEGLEWLKLALDRFRALPPIEGEVSTPRQRLLAKALFAQGMVNMATGDNKFSQQSLQESISIARLTGDKSLLGYNLGMYYIASAFENMLDGADAAEEGFAIFSEIDNSWGLSMAYMNMARISLARGDRETSQKYYGLLKEKMNEAPISFMTGMAYLGTGYMERSQGHLDSARLHFEEGLNIFKRLRHKGFETVMLSEIGHIARAKGDMSQAKKIYQQTIIAFLDLGNRGAIAHQLECFAFLAKSNGETQLAIKLFGAGEALREKISARMTEYERAEYGIEVTKLRKMLNEMEFNSLWAEGRAMTMEQAVQLAMS